MISKRRRPRPPIGRLSGLTGTAALLVMSACIDAKPATLLTDLRYVAASVEPPDVSPGDGATASFLIVDAAYDTTNSAASRTLDYAFVVCSKIENFGDCLEIADLAGVPGGLDENGNVTEEGYRAYFQHYVQTGQTGPGLLSLRFSTPYALQFVLTTNGEPGNPEADPPLFSELPGSVRLLTCAPDLCLSLLQEIRDYQQGLEIGETGQSLYARVTSSSILEDLSMAETALGIKDFVYSLRQGSEINQNPTMNNLTIQCGDSASDPAGGVICALNAALSSDARQFYTAYDEEGTAASTQETLTIDWYSTAGEPVSSGPGGPPGTSDDAEETPLPEAFETQFALTGTEAASQVSFYVVLRDNRKGQSWRALEIIPKP